MPTRTQLHKPHLIPKPTTSARIIFASLILCLGLTTAALVAADDQSAISSDAIIHHLSSVVSWYRDMHHQSAAPRLRQRRDLPGRRSHSRRAGRAPRL